MDKKQYAIVGVGSGWGAQDMRTAFGPRVLSQFLSDAEHRLFAANILSLYRLDEWHIKSPESKTDIPLSDEEWHYRLDRLLPVIRSTAEHVHKALSLGYFPLVFGGDHSIALGTWAGIKKAHLNENIGLIWIDAHMDAHTPHSSESRCLHGMPLAALLGYGDSQLTHLAGEMPTFLPENVVLMGLRSYESAEKEFLSHLGVRMIFADETPDAQSFTNLFTEALAIASHHGTQKFGITIDLDAFDPKEMPGVGSPAAGGLRYAHVEPAFHGLFRHPLCVAAEIMEFNPHRGNLTKSLLFIQSLLALFMQDNRL